MPRAGDQLSLFGGAASGVSVHVEESDRELASRLPRIVRFGTSSWSFPGWRGVLWKDEHTPETLAKDGLEAYARHPLFRSVGLDRSYYGPLRDEDAEGYARQLAAADAAAPGLLPFRMASKVWDEITTAVFPAHPRYGARAGQKNPAFLDPERFLSDVLAPYVRSGLAAYAGPFVVELTPMPRGALDPRTLTDRVARFAEVVQEGARAMGAPPVRLAFELRNEELLGARWYDVLAAHGAAHVFTYWTAMPEIRTQLRAPRSVGTSFTVARLMLPRFMRYEDRKKELAPFTRLASPQPEMREDVVSLVREAAERLCDDVYVLVNNKAEGSAPLTIRALAGEIARAFGR